MAGKEYFVTKLTFEDDVRLIKDVIVYEYNGEFLTNPEQKDRNWMVQETKAGYPISVMYPQSDENQKRSWQRGNKFAYENDLFTWKFSLPEVLTKRKTFVSYYHNNDQEYRERFENLFGDLVVGKSVNDGDIDSDNSDEYIKQLIQKEYLEDTTVLIILIGSKTKCRKHVDWEISGALNFKVGDTYSGLLGLILPDHPDFGTGKVTDDWLPPRLSDNFKSEYAILKDWTDNRVLLQSYIEQAFRNRSEKADKRINSRIQMAENLCK